MSKQTKVSIDSQLQVQAENIFIRRPLSFGNWQDVIRLAVHYGLPEIGRVQERERLHQVGIDMRQMTQRSITETKALRSMPTRDRTCPANGERIKCNRAVCNPLKGEPCPKWVESQQNK